MNSVFLIKVKEADMLEFLTRERDAELEMVIGRLGNPNNHNNPAHVTYVLMMITL